MAHYYDTELKRPSEFNFAVDVVDYHAANPPPNGGIAMHWLSQDRKQERKLTFQHFSTQSHRIAVLLRETLGIQPGERLVIIMPRYPSWWEIATACIRTGIVLCPATTLLVDKDIEYRCNRSGASVFVGDAVAVQKLLKVKKNLPKMKHVIQIDGEVPHGVTSFDKALSDIPQSTRYEGPRPPVKAESLIYFTSGTTGYPKMVLHNQISYPLGGAITGKHFLRLKPGQLFWVLSEQGWAKAAWGYFGAWNCGAGLFIFDDRQPFSGKVALEVLHSYPITTFCAPPTAYRMLVLDDMRKLYKQNPPKSLIHCAGAGEPLNPEVIRLWKQASGLEICDGYGQSETICICGNFQGNPIRPGSMGKPSPGVPLFVIDDKGKETATDEEGDIALRVDLSEKSNFFGIFEGYLDENGNLDRRLRDAADGGQPWYVTGDRATRDKDGYFWFVGRDDDVINSAGYRIGPFEVESTLKEHPAVVESAVVSSPDVDRGEVVKAFVVLTPQAAKQASGKENGQKLIKELQDFCKKNAAPYKYPRKIQFVDPTFLPKTISGKIQRKKLKQAEWSEDGSKAKL